MRSRSVCACVSRVSPKWRWGSWLQDRTPGQRVTNLSISNLFSVEGKTVLVTGGSRGIGEMIAAGFLANGATVYISSRKADACDATAKRLRLA